MIRDWKHVLIGKRKTKLLKPCHDCAVTSGFYAEYAERLASESKSVQQKVKERWFCHNSPGMACAGIHEYLEKAK